MITSRSLLAITAVLACAASARALAPDQVGIVVNSLSDGSQKVAEHYRAARQIPRENILSISVNLAGVGWSEANYRAMVVEPLRKQLKERKLEDKIACLVTTFDVPLTVPSVLVTEADKAELAAYRQKLPALAEQLDFVRSTYDRIAPDSAAASAPATTRAKVDPLDIQKLEQQLLAAAHAASQRAAKLAGDARTTAMQQFLDTQERAFGPAGVLPFINIPDGDSATAPQRAQLQKARQGITDINQRIALLAKAPSTDATRREILALRIKNGALAAEAAQVSQWILELEQGESSACLDSELALLWEDNYPRGRWINNPYSLDIYPYAAKSMRLPRVLIVSRLDGLTPAATMDMINTTLKVEKTGLSGVCYFDARGLTGTDAYSVFDADLRKAADYLAQNTTLKVVVENTGDLMKADSAPDAALYCGWYSLRKYVDSCQWKPGFVGYHVASLEMPSLHAEAETGWVTNLLRRGNCGTLGATEEPYLIAFPKPSQFFPLLVSGQFTQGEVYLLTNPALSWRVGYVGDPLYNPFAAKPALASEKIRSHPQLQTAEGILRALHLRPASPK